MKNLLITIALALFLAAPATAQSPVIINPSGASGAVTWPIVAPNGGKLIAGPVAGNTVCIAAVDTDTGPTDTCLLTATSGTTPSIAANVGIILPNTTSITGLTVGGSSIALAQVYSDDNTYFGSTVAGENTYLRSAKEIRLISLSGATIQLGEDAAGTTAYTLKGNDRITSDGNGGDLTIEAGRGFGTGVGGTLYLASYDTDGAAYTNLLTLTSGTTPDLRINGGGKTLFRAYTNTIEMGSVGSYLNVYANLLGADPSSFGLGGNTVLGWSSGSGTWDNDTVIGREAAAVLQLGADAAGTVNYTLKGNDRITSDGVGGDLTIAAGRGLGAAGGSIYFQTAPAAGAGVPGALATRLTIQPDGNASFAGGITAVGGNISVLSGYGFQIGANGFLAGYTPGVFEVVNNAGTGFTTFNLGPASGNTANGTLAISKVHAETTCSSGATCNLAQIPAGALVLGVTTRISTAVTGCTTLDYGPAGGTANLWGNDQAVALNTTTNGTVFEATSPSHYKAATYVVATCNGGTFSGGVIKSTIFYVSFIPVA